MKLDSEEQFRINEARLCLRLNKLPSELDDEDPQRIHDLIAFYVLEIEKEQAAARQ